MKRSARLTGLVAVLLTCSALVLAPLPARAAEPAEAARWTAQRWVGFHVPGASIDPSLLIRLESRTGIHAAVSNYFQSTEQGFTRAQAQTVSQCGAIPLITLEMWKSGGGPDQPGFSLAAVNSGAFDAYLTSYARDAVAYGKPVWLRPFHEMNGNWYPWCGTVNGNSPEEFAPAWRRVHDIFEAQGASNVRFVWCPNIDSIDGEGRVGTLENSITAYWPGEAYVDYMALDGYNFGEGDGQHWRTFEQLFARPYAEVCSLSRTTPLFVAETGCATTGGSKPAWIADMFAVAPAAFPRVAGIGWFNANKARDWRYDVVAADLEAFRGGLSGGEWAVSQRIGEWKAPTRLGVRVGRVSARTGVPLSVHVTMTPRGPRDRVRVEVLTPGGSRWVTVAPALVRPEGTTWRCSYTPRSPGRYRFRVRFAGDAMREAAGAVSAPVTVH